jgi:hypothetical protein
MLSFTRKEVSGDGQIGVTTAPPCQLKTNRPALRQGHRRRRRHRPDHRQRADRRPDVTHANTATFQSDFSLAFDGTAPAPAAYQDGTAACPRRRLHHHRRHHLSEGHPQIGAGGTTPLARRRHHRTTPPSPSPLRHVTTSTSSPAPAHTRSVPHPNPRLRQPTAAPQRQRRHLEDRRRTTPCRHHHVHLANTARHLDLNVHDQEIRTL